MFKKIFQKKPNYQTNLAPNIPQSKVFFQQAPKPTWTDRNYEQFAREAYMKNVIAFRCVNLIAKSASSIPLEVLELNENGVYVPKQDLGSFKFLTKPNRKQTISLFLEEVYSYILLSGNAFLYMDKEGALINAIESIRPDLMQVLRSNDEEEVLGYKYKTNFVEEAFMFENQTGDRKSVV
jgi:phage portal protein BeeE